MSLKEDFEEKYGTQYTIRKCKQNNCALKDISQDYFIINGDTIKEAGDKSVDCIIINMNSNEDDEYKIILCELTKGEKDIKDATNRFKASGKLIIEYLKNINKAVYKIDCLFLGNITKNGKAIDKKVLNSNKFRIEGLDRINLIQNENCGYSITNFE